MICTGETWVLPFPTWQRAARTVDRIERHQDCDDRRLVVTGDRNAIALFAGETASE